MNKVESALQRTTDTKALVIGVGTLPRTAEMFNELFPGCRAVVVADTNTWRVAGGEVHRILADAGIGQDEPHVFADPKLYAEWSFVEELDGVLAATDAVPVAVGSGVINDLTKLCSHHNGRRYMVVGTAASMDGYTAYGASITKDGNKQTFDCPAPLGMVLDPSISAAAPARMSASGYADLIAKIPAGADWMLSDAVGSEPMDDFAFGLVQDGLKEALSDPAGVHAGNVEKVEQLAEGLLLSGFAMQATQSSRPASGAEHQFSHLWDMEHLKYNGASVSHGFKVGIGTLASTAFLEMLLDAPVVQLDIERCVAAWKSWDETERDIRAIFNDDPEFVARGLKETRDKYVDREGLRDQLTRLKKAWPNCANASAGRSFLSTRCAAAWNSSGRLMNLNRSAFRAPVSARRSGRFPTCAAAIRSSTPPSAAAGWRSGSTGCSARAASGRSEALRRVLANRLAPPRLRSRAHRAVCGFRAIKRKNHENNLEYRSESCIFGF